MSRLPVVDCKSMEKMMARPLVREILREIDLTPEQFRQELDNL